MPDQTPTDASDNPTRTGTFSRVKDLLRPSMTSLKEFVQHPTHIAGKYSAQRSKTQTPSVADQSTNAPPLTEMPAGSEKPESSPTGDTSTTDPWGPSRLSMHSLINVRPEGDHSNADSKLPSQSLLDTFDPDRITQLPPRPSYPARFQGKGKEPVVVKPYKYDPPR